jgi:hypothetical protein
MTSRGRNRPSHQGFDAITRSTFEQRRATEQENIDLQAKFDEEKSQMQQRK